MEVEVIEQYASVERVDDAIRQRYLELVEDANPEDLAKLLDSWSKYIAARRNSDVFQKEETEAERRQRETAATIQEALRG